MIDRWHPNPLLGVELSVQPQFHGVLVGQATEVRDEAERLARASMPEGQTRWMPRRGQRTFEVDAQVTHDGIDAAVINTDHGGHLQEWGSKNNPPYAPLRRAARAVGLRLREQPK